MRRFNINTDKSTTRASTILTRRENQNSEEEGLVLPSLSSTSFFFKSFDCFFFLHFSNIVLYEIRSLDSCFLSFLKGLKNSEILVIHIFQEKC